MTIIIDPDVWSGAPFDAGGISTSPPMWWQMLATDNRWWFDGGDLAGVEYRGGNVRLRMHTLGETDGTGYIAGVLQVGPIVEGSVVIDAGGETFTDAGGVLTGDEGNFGSVDYDTGFWELVGTFAFAFTQGTYVIPSGASEVAVLPPSLVFAWEIVEPAGPFYSDFVFYYTLDHGAPVPTTLGAEPATGSITVEIPDGTVSFEWGVYSEGWDLDSPSIYYGTVAVGEAVAANDYNCECSDERTDRTLLDLRISLLRRLGFSAQATNPPPGMADLLNDFLRDAQQQLYRRFDALRTERFFRWTMTVGGRFYGVRADDNETLCDLRLDPYKVSWVGIEDLNGAWMPLICGIHPTLYTSVAQVGIPSRYEIRQCIEVFPAPAEVYRLRVKGHFGLQSFVNDADQTSIDSEAVFLLALAQAKAHYRQPDAGNYFSQANSYIGALVAGSHHTRRYVPRASERSPLPRPRMVSWDDE